MQVYELAEDLKVDSEALIALLRQMGIPVTDEDATITDGQMAKVLARVERERRAGRKDASEAIRAALEEATPSGSRRRRRRAKEELPEVEAAPEEAPAEEAATAEPEEPETPEVTAAAPVEAPAPKAARPAPAPEPEPEPEPEPAVEAERLEPA